MIIIAEYYQMPMLLDYVEKQRTKEVKAKKWRACGYCKLHYRLGDGSMCLRPTPDATTERCVRCLMNGVSCPCESVRVAHREWAG